MTWQELNNVTGKRAFNPESAEVESLPIFQTLKRRMAALGWVYDGSLRWSVNSRLLRIVFDTGKCAVIELWHTDGTNDLMRRLSTDCNEQSLTDALIEIGIDAPTQLPLTT